MTPREALFILDDENKCSKRDIEAFTVLKDFITATEHVPTLEKLGYKEEKSDKDLQLLKHYVKDSLQINFVKLFGKVLVVKWNNGNVVAIADDELLACAKIIKQMKEE